MSDDFDNFYDQDFEYDEDFVGEDVYPAHSVYERWRPALAAFAVLITVVAIGMFANDRGNGGASGSSDSTVEQSDANQAYQQNHPLLTGEILQHMLVKCHTQYHCGFL